MKIWRIQDKKGRGPYYENLPYSWTKRKHNTPRNPAPHEEPAFSGIDVTPYHFGFSSMRQLRAWFDRKELTALYKMDFEIVVSPHSKYRVDVESL